MKKQTQNPSNKLCIPERKRPEYKPKPKKDKKENPEELKPYEVHFFDGIPYILIGWPGFETPYAVDEKMCIDYALTGVLRKKLDELNQTENHGI